MATSEEIQIGIALEKEIRDLKYFSKCIHDAAANFDIDRKAIINIETEKRFSIFGSHSFGCGRHQTTVNVPKSLIDDLQKLTNERIIELQKEFDNL